MLQATGSPVHVPSQPKASRPEAPKVPPLAATDKVANAEKVANVNATDRNLAIERLRSQQKVAVDMAAGSQRSKRLMEVVEGAVTFSEYGLAMQAAGEMGFGRDVAFRIIACHAAFRSNDKVTATKAAESMHWPHNRNSTIEEIAFGTDFDECKSRD